MIQQFISLSGKKSFFYFLVFSYFFKILAVSGHITDGPDKVSFADVHWTATDGDPKSFMPLGNGDIGINVWCNASGEVNVYLSKSDCWGYDLDGSTGSGPNKLGMLKIDLPKIGYTKFSQTLNLMESAVEIIFGKETEEVVVKVWVDANHPVIQFDISSGTPINITVTSKQWKGPIGSAIQYNSDPNALGWYYANEQSPWNDYFNTQLLKEEKELYPDKLLNLTYGGLLKGRDLQTANDSTLFSSKPLKSFNVSCFPFVYQTPDKELWNKALYKQIASIEQLEYEYRKSEHQYWWRNFWNRSWIELEGSNPEVSEINKGYVLQRFITACAGRGRYPIKFNGTLFTTDETLNNIISPDSRRWGAAYWFQNTRLIYWPMLEAGDFDMMQPFFNLYHENLNLRKIHTKKIFNTEGVVFPEVMHFFGLYRNTDFTRKNSYIWKDWNSGLELSLMMFEYYEFTNSQPFLQDTLLPLVTSVIRFWDTNFPRVQGKLSLDNINALESHWGINNPACDIAGLLCITNKLISLDQQLVSATDLQTWKRLKDELPEIPIATDETGPWILPYQNIASGGIVNQNTELPELYPVFPFKIYSVGNPGLETGQNTYRRRKIFSGDNTGWRQDMIFAAQLGLTEEAKKQIVKRYASVSAKYLFPLYGPNFDWTPDQTHANVANLTLQHMLLQYNKEKIYLLPAWPLDWDVKFKLQAPGNTTVEVVYKEGSLISLQVTPEERKKDVVFPAEISYLTETSGDRNDRRFYFSCFPNPAKDAIYIRVENDFTTAANLEVFNNFGIKVLGPTAIISETDKIDIAHLPSGIYQFILELKGKRMSQKVIVQ